MGSCGGNTVPTDRYSIGKAGWLEDGIDTFQKKLTPLMITASRVAVMRWCILASPQLALAGFAVGVTVGYKWPGAYEMNVGHISIGCAGFKEIIANRKLPTFIAIVISTLDLRHHMMHDKTVGVPIGAYLVGQYIGKEVNAFVKNLSSFPQV